MRKKWEDKRGKERVGEDVERKKKREREGGRERERERGEGVFGRRECCRDSLRW